MPTFPKKFYRMHGTRGWIRSKDEVGYEMSFTKYFDEYRPPQNRARALFPPDLMAWIRSSQPQLCEALSNREGKAVESRIG